MNDATPCTLRTAGVCSGWCCWPSEPPLDLNHLLWARYLVTSGRVTDWPDGAPVLATHRLGTWCSVALVVGAWLLMFAALPLVEGR